MRLTEAGGAKMIRGAGRGCLLARRATGTGDMRVADASSKRRPFLVRIARFLNRLDPLVRHLIVNWALGAAAGVISATALLAVDPFGLRPLLAHSDMAAVALFLLYVGFMTTFGGLVCAGAVMFPPKDDETPRGGLRGNTIPANWKLKLAYASARRRV